MPCALTVSPLIRAMLDHLRQQAPTLAPGLQEQRLMQALADQLALAPCATSYLPHSDDALLGPVLDALATDPADNRGLAQWAVVAHTTTSHVSASAGTTCRSAFTSPTDTACKSTRGLCGAASDAVFPNRSDHPPRCLRAQNGAEITPPKA